jgi:hypothetical protein
MKNTVILLGILGIIGLIAVLILMGSGGSEPDVFRVEQKYEDSLISCEGVTGICTSPETREIMVMVENQSVADSLPGALDGCQVRTMVTGKLTTYGTSIPGELADTLDLPAGPAGNPLQGSQTSFDANAYAASITRTGADRPVVGGISVGSAGFPRAAGTLGIVVEDTTGKNQYVLSCAHVLAFNSNGDFVPIGTPVWQPGGYNAGSPVDQIAVLSHYIPITYYRTGINYADAAIASLEVTGLPYQVLDSKNGTFYTLNGTTNVSVGDVVRKSGISTGVTTSQVLATDALARVFVTDEKWALFRDQIITDAIGAPGDSGSAIDLDGKFVGLYFAGSENVSIICKAEHILGALNVTI